MQLEKRVPTLWSAVNALSESWTAAVIENLERRSGSRIPFPKIFTDPVLGPIELFDWEVAILDSPLLQRLRGVRQLGMASAVYTGATHDRLSHSLGVVETCERMIRSLEKNASHHRDYGVFPDEAIPPPSDADRWAARLAALLHDVGHGPFSHATEPLIQGRNSQEFGTLHDLLREEFPGAENIKVSESMAALVVLSESLQKVFHHPRFKIPIPDRETLPLAVCARIVGSWLYLTAPYLSGIVSGPIDADKLDYMARDSYFTGLPIGLDVDRLISKLEVVTITPDNVLDPALRKRAEKAPHHRLYEIGISMSGLTAYEQMIIGRVLLFDRVYYHHKVRCGEAMIRRLVTLAEEERARKFSLPELFANVTDDGMIYLLSGEMKAEGEEGGGQRSRNLGTDIRTRHFYYRAFAFAERFLAGLDGLSAQEQTDTRAKLWDGVLHEFVDPLAPGKLAEEIHALALKLADMIEEFSASRGQLKPEHILLDLPENRVAVAEEADQGGGVFLRTEGGGLTDANLYFNADKWSDAYKNQKQCGFVFCPPSHVRLVALACQILFFQKFGLIMRREANHLCKTDHLINEKWQNWMKQALDAKLCTQECHDALTETCPRLLLVNAAQIDAPADWLTLDTRFKARIAAEFGVALPAGLVASLHSAVINSFNHLCHALDVLEKCGAFVSAEKPDEKRHLQAELLKILRARGLGVKEGTEIAGGESDLLLPGDLILENKVVGETRRPQEVKPEAAWQARRYSIAVNRRVAFVVVAYKPADESALLILPSRVSVYPLLRSPEAAAVVRFLVPWGYGTPSTAKVP